MPNIYTEAPPEVRQQLDNFLKYWNSKYNRNPETDPPFTKEETRHLMQDIFPKEFKAFCDREGLKFNEFSAERIH
jgi:hypothetical protein